MLAPSAHAQVATAGVTANVVTPTEVTAASATDWLISDSAGVFNLRIPGAASSAAIDITAKAVAADGGTVIFYASTEGAEALRRLIAQMIASSKLAPLHHPSANIGASGTINTEGVQIVLIKRTGDDASGIIAAIITFD